LSSNLITPLKKQKVRLDSNSNGFTNRIRWNNKRWNASYENEHYSRDVSHQHQRRHGCHNRTVKRFEYIRSNNRINTTNNCTATSSAIDIQTRSADLSDLPGFVFTFFYLQ
jgi:hypothetical protein